MRAQYLCYIFPSVVRYEKEPIKVFWGESFDRSLMNLRSLLKDTKREGNLHIMNISTGYISNI